jgi:hypothetical protein
MRPMLRNTALVVAATIASSMLSNAASAIDDVYLHPKAPSNNCAWNGWNAPADRPVFDGPTEGVYYTGPYRGPFARVATPEEANCLMQCRVRPTAWGPQYYTVQVCRGDHVVRSRVRRVNVELK